MDRAPNTLNQLPVHSQPQRHAHSSSLNLQCMSEKLQPELAFVDDRSTLHHSAEHRHLPSGDHHQHPHSTRQSNPVAKNATPQSYHPPATPIRASSLYRPQQPYVRPRGLRIANLLKPWIPLLMYGATTFGFVVAIAFWRTELFEFLDELSTALRTHEHGHAILFFLIFLTTFPPIPLYSTLTILSGYTFGPWTGAIVSYFSALTGAIAVFTISRTLLRDCISRWLNSTTTIKRVVRAIEKRPKLLFLIRLAPYPYNVMNSLLAASPTLTFKTYTICTALSLFKVIIHTSLGASMHSFKAQPDDTNPSSSEESIARSWTIIGVLLCIAIFIYLSIVARRAVDEELDEDAPSEERISFLSADVESNGELMSETRSGPLFPPRQQSVEGRFVNSNEGW